MTSISNHKWPGIICLLLCALLTGPSAVYAQINKTPISTHAELVSLAATTADGAPFDMATLRGRVAVIFYWGTGCAVCRDSLPELRANLTGWREKPFSLVVVNVDRRAQDWLTYESVHGKFQAPFRGYVSVRQVDATTLPIRLPLTLVVDAKGKVVQRIEGRVAPEVWDTVADLIN